MQNGNVYDKSTPALVLGIVSCIAWLIPLFGVPVSIIGIVFGAKSLDSPGHGKALTGMILSIIFLILSVLNAFAGMAMMSE